MKKVILLVTLFYGYKKIKDLARKQKSFKSEFIQSIDNLSMVVSRKDD